MILLLKVARALNNNEPFPGERLLRRLLDKTYYAHILPPLPESEATRRGKRELGISFDSGHSLGRDLAISHGLGRGRGRDIGI